MAIIFSTITKPAVKVTSFSNGTEDLILFAGDNLKIETSPVGEEILNITVPIGKSWAVSVTVSIAETDI